MNRGVISRRDLLRRCGTPVTLGVLIDNESPRHGLRVRQRVFGALIRSAVFSLGASLLIAWSPADARAPQLSPPAATRSSGAIHASTADNERAATELLEQWTPTFLQHVSREHTNRDVPLRIDFDGDWDATNNWDDLDAQKALSAAVYASAILTRTHAYLTYTLFYPRDWMSGVCVPYLCHDNDLEVSLVVVERAHGASPNRLAVVETKAHHVYDAVPGERAARDEAGHPVIEVESEGHGMYPVRAGRPIHGRGDEWVTLVGASHPESKNRDRTLRYDLQSLHDTLWRHRALTATNDGLWARGEGKALYYRGAQQGRMGFVIGTSMANRRYTGGVSPPWALHASAGERGDWFLDPAFVAVRRYPSGWLSASASPSLAYELNPFLTDLRDECEYGACPAELHPEPIPRMAWIGSGGALALLAARLSPRAMRLRLSRIFRRRQPGRSQDLNSAS